MVETRGLNLNKISKKIQKFKPPKLVNDKEWRNRDAIQILSSGYSNGCSDDAILFKYFTEPSEIPTFYVETIEKRWLENLQGRFPRVIEGHVFCDVIFDDRIVCFDPRNGGTRIENGCYLLKTKSERIPYVILAKGLNFSDMHLKNDGRYETQPTSIKTHENLRAVIKKKYPEKFI